MQLTEVWKEQRGERQLWVQILIPALPDHVNLRNILNFYGP